MLFYHQSFLQYGIEAVLTVVKMYDSYGISLSTIVLNK